MSQGLVRRLRQYARWLAVFSDLVWRESPAGGRVWVRTACKIATIFAKE